MTDALLAAITRAVTLRRGAYTWSEAISCASIEHGLDEFQTEDLESLARNQYRRLQEQTK